MAQSTDSLRRAVAQAEEPGERLWAMIDLMQHYRMRNQDSAIVLYEQVTELAVELNDPDAEVAVYLARGSSYHNKGELDKALREFYQGLAIAESTPGSTQLGPVCQNIGLSHYRGSRLDSAYFYFVRAEEAFLEQEETYDIWRTYWGLASVYERTGETERAEEMIAKALAILEREGKRVDHGFFLYNMYAFYYRQGDFDKMAVVRQKWQAYQERYKTGREVIEMPEHTGLTAFLQVSDDSLRQFLIRGLTHYDSIGNYFMEAWNCEELGDLALRNADQHTAKEYYLTANAMYQEYGLAFRRARTLRQLYQVCRQLNQYPEALGFFSDYHQLTDSLFRAEAGRNLQQLQVQYQTEKKEQALRINQLELGQKTVERNLLLGSSILLAILAATIFLGLRMRLRTNGQLAWQEKQLQEQRIQQLEQEQKIISFNAMIEGQEQERLRIAKDLHDGLGGLLTTVKAYFGSLSVPPSDLQQKTVDLIDDACVEVRRISHNMMPTALLLSGFNGALEDLADQLRQNGYQCHLELMGSAEELQQTQSVMLYRIVQELTNNIQKHAAAGQILIQLLRHQDELTLIVEDDGCGFDLEQAYRQSSVGLKSIDSRVRYLQGIWNVDSVPGEGTTVTVRIPLC